MDSLPSLIERKESKKMAKITADYDGKPIPEGHVLVPFEYNPLEVEDNEAAMANVRTILKAGRYFTVIYKAVPVEYAALAKSQFNLVQNEELGHYIPQNTVSMDEALKEYDLQFATVPSVEEAMLEAEQKAETINGFFETVEKLIERSPQLGLALILDILGKKGEEFAYEMGITHNKANEYHNKAHELLINGWKNIDFDALRTRRSPRHDEYLEKAYKLLDTLIEMLPE